MKKLILLLFIPLFSYSQSWRVETKDDAFLGKTKIAFTIGYGGEFPYEDPVIVFRDSESDGISAYVIRMGSLVCGGASLTFAFNGKFEDKLKLNLTPSKDNDTGYFDEDNFELMNSLVEKLKSSNYAEVLLNTDCSSNRFTISLKGSTAALNSVIKDYFKEKLDEENELNNEIGLEFKEWKREIDSDIANIFLNYELSDNAGNEIGAIDLANLVYEQLIDSKNNTLFKYYKSYEESSLLITKIFVKKNYSGKYVIQVGDNNTSVSHHLFHNSINQPIITPIGSDDDEIMISTEMQGIIDKEIFINQLTDTLNSFNITSGKSLLEDRIKMDFEFDKKDYNNYRGLIVEPYYDNYIIDFESHGVINIYYETIDGGKEVIDERLNGLIMIETDSDYYNKLKILSNPDDYLLSLVDKYSNVDFKIELLNELRNHIKWNSLSQEDISNIFITANRSLRLIKSITVYYTFQNNYETQFEFKPKTKLTTSDIINMGGRAGKRF